MTPAWQDGDVTYVLLRRLALFVLFGILLAACAPTVKGEADAGQVPPLESGEALGDLTTVDFCTLLDKQGLREADVSVELATSGFLRCTVEVELGMVGLSVTIGDLYWATPFVEADESRELARSVHRRHFEEEAVCWRELVFSDEVALDISVYESYGDIGGAEGDAEMCIVADLVTDGVQQAVYSGGGESMTFPEGSLDEQEPCSLLSADEVIDVLDVEDVMYEHALGGGGCSWWWWFDESYVGTDVEFGVVDLGAGAADPEAYYGDEVAGRPTRTDDFGDGQCRVETPHMIVPSEVPTELEVVSVYTYGKDDESCTAARKLAKLAWTRLPEYEG